MSREQLLRTTLLGLAVALGAAGCAAGQVTQTSAQASAVNGAMADVGSIALRDVVLAYPGGEDVLGYEEGDDAPLRLTIVNSGDRPDELVSVTTPAAGDVTVDGMTTIPGSFAVTSTEGGTSASAGAGVIRVVLTDLTGPIRPGLPTSITFRFRDAGKATLQVPIDAPAETREE